MKSSSSCARKTCGAINKICVSTALIGLILAGCKPPPSGSRHSDASAHGHDHEAKTAQINAWTNGFEVFAEHQAPVAGKPTTFITHVTDLATGEPRREGAVLFLVSQGETSLEHLESKPARAGIYLPELKFPSVGSWRLELVISFEGKEARISLGEVSVVADDHAAAHAEIPNAPEGLSFLKEQQWKIPMRIEPASVHAISEQVRLSSRLLPLPGSTVSIPVLSPGIILPPPEGPMPRPGDPVKAGQVIARLQLPFSDLAVTLVEARSQAAKARTALEQAEVNLERTRRLVEQQARSQRELQEAEFAFRAAQATANAALALENAFGETNTPAQENASTILLTAPFDGILASTPSVDKNEFVVQRNGSLLLQAAVPQTEVHRFGEEVRLAVQPLGATNLYTYSGARFGPILDPQTATLPLSLAIVEPPPTLRAGTHAIVFAETKVVENSLALPLTAIVDEDGRPSAYVQLSGETFEKRDLSLGIRDRRFVQVLSGLQEGERVVTSGAFAIRLAAASSTIPAHGHAH